MYGVFICAAILVHTYLYNGPEIWAKVRLLNCRLVSWVDKPKGTVFTCPPSFEILRVVARTSISGL